MQEPTSRERVLRNALRALAEDDARDGASADVEARLLSEVRALARARRRTQAKLLAIAAILIMAVTIPVWQLAERPPAAPPTPAPSDSGSDIATEFYPLTFSNVPMTGGHLVRLEVSRVALASFGLLPAESLGSRPGTVLADVLVGEDGLARAVRFVRTESTPAQEFPR
jgi:hypothetical protein